MLKKSCKVRDHWHYTSEYKGVALSICNLKGSLPKEISEFFYNGSSYDDNFTIKELAE